MIIVQNNFFFCHVKVSKRRATSLPNIVYECNHGKVIPLKLLCMCWIIGHGLRFKTKALRQCNSDTGSEQANGKPDNQTDLSTTVLDQHVNHNLALGINLNTSLNWFTIGKFGCNCCYSCTEFECQDCNWCQSGSLTVLNVTHSFWMSFWMHVDTNITGHAKLLLHNYYGKGTSPHFWRIECNDIPVLL